MNFKGTKGTWEINHFTDINGKEIGSGEIKNGSRVIATFGGLARIRGEEGTANAKLIAAAPELLKALIRAKNYMREFGCTDQLEFDRIESTIKEATE